jgi:hypothetical protein
MSLSNKRSLLQLGRKNGPVPKRQKVDNSLSNNSSTFNWEEISNNILSKCTKADEHLLWSEEYADNITVTCNTVPYQYSPQKWLRFCKEKMIIKHDDKLFARVCKTKRCVNPDHYFFRTIGITSVDDMNSYEINVYTQMIHNNSTLESNGCRIWMHKFNEAGYPMMSLNRKPKSVHKLSCELKTGKSIPSYLHVRHLCGNAHCVLPEHLEPGTANENCQDQIKHKTKSRGETHGNAVLNEVQAKTIIELLNNGKSRDECAEQFNVNKNVIEKLDNAVTWKHLFTEDELKVRQQKRKKTKKLSTEMIDEIKKSKGLLTIRERAKKFEVCKNTISNIDNELNFNSQERTSDPDDNHAKYYLEKRAKIESDSIKSMSDNVTHWLWPTQTKFGYATRMRILQWNLPVHRASYVVFNNITDMEQIKNLQVRHKCKFKHCVAPTCLEIGTAKDNANDKYRDGTMLHGAKHPAAKLSDDQISEIRKLKTDTSITKKKICQKFNISRPTLRDILKQKGRFASESTNNQVQNDLNATLVKSK